LTLNLHLKTIHKLFTIQDAFHPSGIRLCKSTSSATFGGIRCSNILSITKHEVQLSGFQFIPLSFLGTEIIQAIILCFQLIGLASLDLNDMGLLVNLLLQLCYQAIRTELDLCSHLISLSHSRVGNLTGLGGFIKSLTSL
jgi:hypothetical protein